MDLYIPYSCGESVSSFHCPLASFCMLFSPFAYWFYGSEDIPNLQNCIVLPIVTFRIHLSITGDIAYRIYHAASLRWVYWVLDWSKPTAVGLYLLNPLFLCAAFLFW